MNRGQRTVASLLTVSAGLLAASATIQAVRPARHGGVAAAEPGPPDADDEARVAITDLLQVLARTGRCPDPPAPITYTSSAISSPVATAMETVVASVTLPADCVAEGTAVRFRAGGSGVGSGNDLLVIRCRLGPEADCTFTFAPVGSENWAMQAEMIVYPPGPPTSDVWVNGLMGHGVPGLPGTFGGVEAGARLDADLSGDVTASIRLFFSPWHDGDTATVTNCSIELIPRPGALSTP